MTDARGRTVVIGLGNPLMGDDGIGLAALERLRADGCRGRGAGGRRDLGHEPAAD